MRIQKDAGKLSQETLNRWSKQQNRLGRHSCRHKYEYGSHLRVPRKDQFARIKMVAMWSHLYLYSNNLVDTSYDGHMTSKITLHHYSTLHCNKCASSEIINDVVKNCVFPQIIHSWNKTQTHSRTCTRVYANPALVSSLADRRSVHTIARRWLLPITRTHRRRRLTVVIIHKREATKLVLSDVVDDGWVDGCQRRLLGRELPVKVWRICTRFLRGTATNTSTNSMCCSNQWKQLQKHCTNCFKQ